VKIWQISETTIHLLPHQCSMLCTTDIATHEEQKWLRMICPNLVYFLPVS